MFGYIYQTTNLINGKRYIGKHKSDKFEYNDYLGSGKLLNEAIKKYGKENFNCELIERCNSIEELNQKEQYWINKYNAVESSNFYNLARGGDGGDLSPYIDYSNCPKGPNNWNYGKKFQWINNGIREVRLFENDLLPDGYVYGRLYKVSDELKIKLSNQHSGVSPVNKGIPMSEEQKRKVSLSRKGKCCGQDNPSKNPEVRKKLSQKYICPICNNYISTKSCVIRHINKNHKINSESATTIENIDWKKYLVE